MNETKLNKIYKDQFGRISGVLALNKPAGITSHDLVDRVREKLGVRRVGHCGALDPFATGLMIILVGSSTSLSNNFLNHDKEYEFDMLLGISTDSADPDGSVLKTLKIKHFIQKKLIEALKSFEMARTQQVPVFSSVKVNGMKLRELARNCVNYSIKDGTADFKFDRDSSFLKRLVRKGKTNTDSISIKIPSKEVTIYEIRLLNISKISGESLKFIKSAEDYPLLKVYAKVSKGVYIRQLAVDIGEKLGGIPAMLYSLKRLSIGDISLDQAIDIDDVAVINL